MKPDRLLRRLVVLCILVDSLAVLGASLRVGVAALDVSPPTLPVIQNGGFLESTLSKVLDPLHSRAFVFDDGEERLAIVVVDSCMLPRDLCDQAKALAAKRTELRPDRIAITATHTHTAPSVMDFCLGSRHDPRYTAFLPHRIAESIVEAYRNRQPARVASVRVDAGDFTKNRRWITRPDKMGVDPFGERTVRAMMHPGHQNPDYIGPSGPIDPWLTLLSIQSIDGSPLGVLANFSMHYFGGHPGVSADYCGEFARQLSQAIAPEDEAFVVSMSQGTSGDLWWGDYSLPRRQSWSLKEYTAGLVAKAVEGLAGAQYKETVSLAMAERRVTLERRLPDEARLKWAREKLASMGENRPRNRPEVYAEQAQFIHENPAEEVVLQAMRIGGLGVVGMPNEVYALTGLKIKSMSPLPVTMNLSLANGAAGYIPPPEQHALGGYTTWPARTAGLEVEAEPKIVSIVGHLLEEVSSESLKSYREPEGRYATRIRESEPRYRWRMGDQQRGFAGPSTDAEARFEGRVAFYLPGVGGRGFGGPYESRAVQFVGGRLVVPDVEVPQDSSVEFWFLPSLAGVGEREVLFEWNGVQLGLKKDKLPANVARLEIGGQQGATPIQVGEWYHVVMVRASNHVSLYLNGVPRPEVALEVEGGASVSTMVFGDLLKRGASFEGRLDEIALFSRALDRSEIRSHFRSAMRENSAALSPKESMARTHVREGYRLELVAAEPLTMDPVAIDWGADGRLWVVEMADYPYGMDGQGMPGGRVRWLVDDDQDGTYDHSQVFLDGINFPTSVMPWRNGVLVTAAPEVFYAEDRDGDGRADTIEVLFRGFMEGNQQLRVNSLRWGLDGWIYCASGGHHAGFGARNGIELLRRGQSIILGSRDFRFLPDTGHLVPLSGPGQFGRVRDDWGHWFGVQNSHPLWHWVLPDSYLQRNPAVSYPDPRVQLREPRNPRVYMNKPVQKRYHSFEQSSRFTSACGPSIYRDQRLFPEEPGVTHAFTCEPFHNVVQHHVLTDLGVSFAGRRASEDGARDFFASADRWCRPVMTRTGPDGALYVVDMYRYMIEHPDWLPPEGKEELKPFYRSGESRGRIYRIVPRGTADDRPVMAAMFDDEALIRGMASSNGRIRDLAQQRIVEGARVALVPELEQLLRDHPEARTRLQAMGALYGLKRLGKSQILIGLADPHPSVRSQAIRFSEGYSAEAPDGLRGALCGMVGDTSPRVRFQLALSLGDFSGADYSDALIRLARDQRRDARFRAAVMSSAPEHFEALVGSVASMPEYAADLAQMGGSEARYYEAIADVILSSEETPWTLLSRWIDSLEATGGAWDERVAEAGGVSRQQLRGLKARLVKARKVAREAQSGSGRGASVFALLGRLQEFRSSDLEFLLESVSPKRAQSLRRAAIENLGRFQERLVAERLLGVWRELLPEDRGGVLELLLGRADWSNALLGALETGTVGMSELSASHRQRFLRHADKGLATKARRFFERSESGRQDLKEALVESTLAAEGSAASGRRHFEMRCATCHEVAGVGQAIGPDLRAVSDRSGRGLLRSIVDPNLAVEPKYLGYTFGLNDGTSVHGMVVRETAGGITVQRLDGSIRTISRAAIGSVESGGLSFMPEGLEAGMSGQDMADLLAFLQSAM